MRHGGPIMGVRVSLACHSPLSGPASSRKCRASQSCQERPEEAQGARRSTAKQAL